MSDGVDNLQAQGCDEMSVNSVVAMSSALDDAVPFLETLFEPGDTVLFRPIEIWQEQNRRRNRVDYKAGRYVLNGIKNRHGAWCPYTKLLFYEVAWQAKRAEQTRTNIFFGVSPRIGGDGRFDQAWQIRTVRTLWSDIDDTRDLGETARC